MEGTKETQHLLTSKKSASSLDSGTYNLESSMKIPPKVSKHRYAAAIVILFVELAERMTFYGLICNLVLLATSELKFSSLDAVTINLVFQSGCYFVPVLGGFISDVFCGYFNTILGSGLIYIVGAVMFPILTFNYQMFGEDHYLNIVGKRALCILGLIFIVIATGGIKSNVGPFGAEQLLDAGPNATQTYFTWFYWFINVGAFIAYTLIAYVQQEVSFFAGFVIPAATMMVAMIILVVSKSLYRIPEPQGSVLPKIFHIIRNAYRVKRSAIIQETSTLDYARRRNGGDYADNDVDDVKALIHILPIFLLLIVFWIVYNQMSSTFFLQGERMDVRIGSLNLPAASLSLFNSLAILIIAPLLDRIVYPILDRCWQRPSQLVRMGIGMILAALSVLVGGILEIYRKKDIETNGALDQVLGNQHFNASSLSVLYQIPQFALLGSGEIFLAISGQEFAFSEAPESVKSAVMGLYLVTNGVGSLLGSVMINVANAISAPNYWIPDEVNKGYMENYLFLLAGFMMFNFIIYVLVARKYRYNNAKSAERYQIRFVNSQNGTRDTRSTESSDEEVTMDMQPSAKP